MTAAPRLDVAGMGSLTWAPPHDDHHVAGPRILSGCYVPEGRVVPEIERTVSTCNSRRTMDMALNGAKVSKWAV